MRKTFIRLNASLAFLNLVCAMWPPYGWITAANAAACAWCAMFLVVAR